MQKLLQWWREWQVERRAERERYEKVRRYAQKLGASLRQAYQFDGQFHMGNEFWMTPGSFVKGFAPDASSAIRTADDMYGWDILTLLNFVESYPVLMERVREVNAEKRKEWAAFQARLDRIPDDTDANRLVRPAEEPA